MIHKKAGSAIFKKLSDAVLRRGSIAAHQLPKPLACESYTRFPAKKIPKNAIEYLEFPKKSGSTTPLSTFGFAASHSWQPTRSISFGNPQLKFPAGISNQDGRPAFPSNNGQLKGNSVIFTEAQKLTPRIRVLRSFDDLAQAITTFSQIPLVPLLLGLSGAIPFVSLSPFVSDFIPFPDILQGRLVEAQAAYGACILSFLGGPHWGMAMASQTGNGRAPISFSATSLRYLWSVTPSLLAWPALMLPLSPRLGLLVCSLGLALVTDLSFARNQLLPKWYVPLRVLLTLVGMASLGSSLVMTTFAKPV